MPRIAKDHTTAERAAKHDVLMPMLSAMFGEFKELSKKKPDGALNKKKVEIVNRLLKDVLLILKDEPSQPYLDLLEEDDLPLNSDVLLVLSLFMAAMETFHNKYWIYSPGEGHNWAIK